MISGNHWWKGRRGEWYVALQAVLIAIILFAPKTLSGLPQWPESSAGLYLGGAFIVAGMAVVLLAALHLGSNLTPLPHPKDNARLIVTGLYRLVRHPIYCGVLLMAIGWAIFVQGWLTPAYSAMLVLFFDVKSRREEAWLTQLFPDYLDYQLPVR